MKKADSVQQDYDVSGLDTQQYEELVQITFLTPPGWSNKARQALDVAKGFAIALGLVTIVTVGVTVGVHLVRMVLK